MAASSTAVSVLSPNGRRQTVKVSPNTPLLQVLEEVCKKQGFNPDDHGLKFQRNVLDLTLQWRFASLPNNAKLEVVPSTRQLGGTESTVRIALQLEDGSRLQGSFSSGQTLWELLKHFPQTRITDLDAAGPTPVCVYMRDEISGQDALQKTTLRSLGLTGGSAILRYVVKTSNTLGNGEPMENAATPTDTIATATASQPTPEHLEAPSGASTAVNPPLPDRPDEPTPAPVPMETPSPPLQSSEAAFAHTSQTLPVQKEEAEPSQDQHQAVRPKIRQVDNKGHQDSKAELQMDDEQPGPSHAKLPPHSNFVPFSGGGQRLGGSGGLPPSSSSSSSSSPVFSGPPKAKKSKPSHEVKSSASAKFGAKDSEEREEYLEPVHREPLIYHLDTARRTSAEEDLTDEFFEVTVDDVRKRFSQLKSERRLLEEAPLMTQALREAQMKEKMDRYPKVVLRVQFPDRQVLQGFFRPQETVAALKQFVQAHLQDPDLLFYLFIAPPKTVLNDPNATLFQANLFPAALVYFGSDAKTECYLRGVLLDSSVSALKADELIASCIPRSPAPTSCSQPPQDSVPLEPSKPSSIQPGPEDTSDPESQAVKPARTDPAKVPKWLKLPGKK
ncbi:tether containing UBX domain for GLUT4 [Astyanax mexicanus]|uniref:tether containing UBX domain for GLUT4 n=1 Tax=Astyanax mexicanus TaxID=7994 RepID=UPI0020CACCE3|nr:tether containing UBX domain for GLUT4 [Astyanax mexicanus]